MKTREAIRANSRRTRGRKADALLILKCQGLAGYRTSKDVLPGRAPGFFLVFLESARLKAENISRRGRVKIETKKYPEVLLYTHNYTGFTIFPAGYKEIGAPGGIWDALLKEYRKGKREKPVWAIDTLAFDQQGDLANKMRDLSTILLVRKLSEKGVMSALKKGRMYALKGKNSALFLLDEFFIRDSLSKKYGVSGDTVRLLGKPILYIKGKFIDALRKVELKIIRNGEIVKIYNIDTPFEIVYNGDKSPVGKSYYRLEIRSAGLNLITNPIFVVKK